jgi:hypothetical protein
MHKISTLTVIKKKKKKKMTDMRHFSNVHNINFKVRIKKLFRERESRDKYWISLCRSISSKEVQRNLVPRKEKR